MIINRTRLFALGGVLLLVLALLLSYQSRNDFELPEDLDESYTLEGQTTYLNRDHLFPYNPLYNGTGVSFIGDNYTTVRNISVTGTAANEDYLTFVHNSTIVSQPTFLIDVNNGSVEGGVAEVDFGGGPMAYPFEPHRSHLTTMYLDRDDWSYFDSAYSDNHTGYARSLLTHHPEQQDYELYVGNLGETVTATYEGERTVQGFDGYAYRLHYTWQLPFPIYTNATTGMTVFLVLEETSVEVHETTLGVLIAQNDVVNYSLLVMGQGPPQSILLYTETSNYEISDDDADSLATGLRYATIIGALPIVLGIGGGGLLVFAIYEARLFGCPGEPCHRNATAKAEPPHLETDEADNAPAEDADDDISTDGGTT